MIDFLSKFFIDPIYQHSGYNIVNTVVYGILLGFGIIFSEKVVKRVGLKADRQFLIALLPFILFAAFLRSLVDANVLPTSFFLITPGIFLTVFFVTAISLVFGLFIQRRKNIRYHKIALPVGLILLIYPSTLLINNIITFRPLLAILAIFTASSFLIMTIFILKGIGNKWIHAIFISPIYWTQAPLSSAWDTLVSGRNTSSRIF